MILSDAEYSALQHLQTPMQTSTALVLNLPRRLSEQGYLRYDIQGRWILTEVGLEAMFKKQCFSMLLALSANPRLSLPGDIGEWLNMAGFVKPKIIRGQVFQGDFEIQAKGRDWIVSEMTKTAKRDAPERSS